MHTHTIVQPKLEEDKFVDENLFSPTMKGDSSVEEGTKREGVIKVYKKRMNSKKTLKDMKMQMNFMRQCKEKVKKNEMKDKKLKVAKKKETCKLRMKRKTRRTIDVAYKPTITIKKGSIASE